MPLRVLLLNYEYPPNGGGAGVATEMLARSLAGGGAEVDVVTAGATTTTRTLRFKGSNAAGQAGRLTVHRVKCRRTAVHQAGMVDAASYLLAAHPVICDLLATRRYDVAHFFFSLPTGALIPFLDLDEVPVVVSLRGSDVPGYDRQNTAVRLAHVLLRPVTRWIWRRADRVVAVCESLGALGRRTLPELRYAVVHNGVDLERFRPPAARAFRTDLVRCLAVTRLVERKGVHDLIEAMARLEGGRFRLEIVGNGKDRDRLRALARRLGVRSEIRFTGALGREAVAERYRAADLFTLPSSAEAFGNAFAEALASGLPIVGTRVGGIPELVEHGINGLLVQPGSAAELAAAIRTLADDPTRRRAMAERNRRKAEASLDWSQVTGRYLALYRDLQRARPAPALVAELSPESW